MEPVRPESLVWRPLVKHALPEPSQIKGYNRALFMGPNRNKLQKYFADLGRVCEVEDTINEWSSLEHVLKIYGSLQERSLDTFLEEIRQ